MPKEIFSREYEFLAREFLLTFEEIARLVRLSVGLGVHKVRITGGEPLLRKDLDQLIRMLSEIDGLSDVTLTTNGVLLARQASALADAGLKRVTVSLDSLDDDVFMKMNDVGFPVQRVLDGIDAAARVGLAPIKVNMVVKRGINDDSIVEMADYFRGSGHIVRFIEYMDVGNTNGWRLDDVVPAREIVERIGERFPIEPVSPNYDGEVARRWRYHDGGGEFGVITSVTKPFCSSCTRARVSADGRLYTCLFAAWGRDLRSLLRSNASDEDVAAVLSEVWERRDDNYSQRRSSNTADLRRVEMSYIGG